MKNKVVVTGASGNIGRALVKTSLFPGFIPVEVWKVTKPVNGLCLVLSMGELLKFYDRLNNQGSFHF